MNKLFDDSNWREEYKGMKVPEVLLSGNEKLIQNWREEESIKRTKQRRPDLLE